MDKTSIGDRFKDYERRFTDIRLLPRIPVIVRLDGVAFHTYTKMFKHTTEEPPFSHDFKNAMIHAMIKTANSGLSSLKAIYQQSDEISYLFINDESIHSMPWHDYKVQKIVSIIPSMFTAFFNDYILNQCTNKGYYTKMGFFDGRCFNVPDLTEANNYFVWRQQDFHRNSINMLGRAHFSHKQMNNKNTGEVQEMLFSEKAINWNNLDVWKKRGSLVVKKTSIKNVEYVHGKTGEKIVQEGVKRKEWVEVECPIFTETGIFGMLLKNE